jgi:hypothetical protein
MSTNRDAVRGGLLLIVEPVRARHLYTGTAIYDALFDA